MVKILNLYNILKNLLIFMKFVAKCLAVFILSCKVHEQVCDSCPLIIAYCLDFHAFLSSADFFQNELFEKIISGIT